MALTPEQRHRALLARIDAARREETERIPFDHLAQRFYNSVLRQFRTGYSDLTSHHAKLLNHRDQQISVVKERFEAAFPNYEFPFPALDTAERRRQLRHINRAARKEPSTFLVYGEHTSGSSGAPLQVLRPAHSLHREALRLEHALIELSAGLQVERPTTILYVSHYPGSHTYAYLDLTTGVTTLKISMEFALTDVFASLTPEMGGYALSGTPSTLAAMARYDRKWSCEPVLVLIAGEDCPPEVRDQIDGAFLARSRYLYVAREFGLVGFECPSCAGYHLLDTDFEFGFGEGGRLQITDSTNIVMPFFRYELGDTGTLGSSNLCGSPLPTLRNLRGRPFAKPYHPPE